MTKVGFSYLVDPLNPVKISGSSRILEAKLSVGREPTSAPARQWGLADLPLEKCKKHRSREPLPFSPSHRPSLYPGVDATVKRVGAPVSRKRAFC